MIIAEGKASTLSPRAAGWLDRLDRSFELYIITRMATLMRWSATHYPITLQASSSPTYQAATIEGLGQHSTLARLALAEFH